MARHLRWTRRFLGDEDFDAVTEAIRRAEARTSGEIRVHLERRVRRVRGAAPGAALARARHVFARLSMHRTKERHGVLIYLAVEDRRLAVVGDQGIHDRVGDPHWARVRDLMVERLRAGAPRAALLAAIAAVGEELARHFPRRPGDADELAD